MQVTALIENSTVDGRQDLRPEFGLSLHLEVNETKILFDMGASAMFAANAAAMGWRLSAEELGRVDSMTQSAGG